MVVSNRNGVLANCVNTACAKSPRDTARIWPATQPIDPDSVMDTGACSWGLHDRDGEFRPYSAHSALSAASPAIARAPALVGTAPTMRRVCS